MVRKRRTRSHVIADLAVNHVERQALLAGYSVERFWRDYGTDLNIYTYNDLGEFESGVILVQVKATDSLYIVEDDRHLAVRVESVHLRQWLSEFVPFILVLYDAASDTAYWLWIQEYLRSRGIDISLLGRTHTVRVQRDNRFDVGAVHGIAELKNRMVGNDR